MKGEVQKTTMVNPIDLTSDEYRSCPFSKVPIKKSQAVKFSSNRDTSDFQVLALRAAATARRGRERFSQSGYCQRQNKFVINNT